MAEISLKGNPIHTSGDLPDVGSQAPDFILVGDGLAEKSLADFEGVRVLNVFPSVDTPVCATSVRSFNEAASGKDGVTVLNISADLPFAQQRFCGAEGLDGVVNLSCFRSNFALDYGLEIIDGPLQGLCSRAVIVIAADGEVAYTEQIPEIAQEPNYEAALAAI